MQYGLIQARRPETDPIEDLVFLLLGAFAIFTLTYDIALLVPLSLRSVTVIAAGACLLPLLAVMLPAWRFTRGLGSHIAAHLLDPAAWFLIAMSLLAGTIALLSNRFDADDSFYLARAVLDWENFRAPIAPVYPFALTDGTGGRFPSLPSWEHLWAAAAALTGRHPLDLYHRAAPFLGGALVPFAWYCALARISHTRRAALAGVAAILILMLLDGTTHRGIAYFGLLRIWQGKVVLIAVLTPLALAATLDVMRHGRAADWARLFVLGIAGIGLSTTAAFYLPILVGLAGATFWLVYLPPTRIWQPPLAALAVFAYPALCVLPFYRALVGPEAIFASTIATDLREVLLVVYGTPLAPTVIAIGIAAACLVIARRTRLLGWFTLWSALIALPLAWPPSADFIVRHLTSADTLWRLAYAGPAVLAIGAGIGALAATRYMRLLSTLALLAAAAGTAALAWRQQPPSPFAGTDVAFPSTTLKAPATALATARILLAALPPGTMFAPRDLSVILPMLSARQRLTNFRQFDAAPQLIIDGRAPLGEDLTRAHDYISGLPTTAAAPASLARIAALGLDAIVLSAAMPDPTRAEAILAAAGYREMTLAIPHRVFIRAPG